MTVNQQVDGINLGGEMLPVLGLEAVLFRLHIKQLFFEYVYAILTTFSGQNSSLFLLTSGRHHATHLNKG